MRTAIIYLQHNHAAAEKIRECTGGDLVPFDKGAFKFAFSAYDAMIAVMACGIAVREISPLLDDKWTDPPVVVVDAGLVHAIALCGGHHGANELALALAGIGVHPVITTASEVLDRPSVEGMARSLDCEIVNKDSTRNVGTCLLNSDLPVVAVHGPKVVVVDPTVTVLQKKEPGSGVVVGIGTRKNVPASSVVDAIRTALSECKLALSDVELFASARIKEHEEGIIEAVEGMGKTIVFVPDDIINMQDPPSRSRASELGLSGVCEPSALALSREHTMIMRKKVYDNVTIAIAR